MPADCAGPRRSPRSVAVDEIQQEVGLPPVTAAPRALSPRCLSLRVMCQSRTPADGPGAASSRPSQQSPRPGQRQQGSWPAVWICLRGSGPHPRDGVTARPDSARRAGRGPASSALCASWRPCILPTARSRARSSLAWAARWLVCGQPGRSGGLGGDAGAVPSRVLVPRPREAQAPVCCPGRSGRFAGGARRDLLDVVAWWQADDFWRYALFAAVACIRADAGRAGVPARRVCPELAQRDGPLST